MRKRNILIYTAILFMAIGFATLSTALYINGQINVTSNAGDFDVYFSKVFENDEENNELIIDETHISFTKDLSNVDETYKLEYIVTNGSKNYDADISITCSNGNEYLSVTNDFDEETNLTAGENRIGILIAKVNKIPVKKVSVNVNCEITLDAVSRSELGSEPVEYLKGVYGVRRSRESSETTWERLGDSVGLVAKATKNGSSVQNDFDNIYPWSDIITYNYNDVTKIETAVYGDANFKFDGSNGQVLTRIPEFWYKREVKDGYEYVFISEKEQEGYTKSEAFSVGRYTISGNATKVYSRSGVTPLVYTSITDFRNYARALDKETNQFGQLDWRYFIIQLLYVVEYADYNIQNALGLGYTNSSNTSTLKSGGCNNLGMKSGSIVNDGKHSVIYRGIEDIFGNVWQFIDGINIKDNVTYINYNHATYAANTFDGDYQSLGYVNARLSGYITHLGYDSNYPLVAFPTAVGGDVNSYISDTYYQNTGNRIAYVGGDWKASGGNGLWCFCFDGGDSTYKSVSSRLLRYQ